MRIAKPKNPPARQYAADGIALKTQFYDFIYPSNLVKGP